jgi:DNA polymerase-3 subunit epsilon
VPVTQGLTARPAETFLTERAVSLLAAGPVDAVTLIEYVCQMPGAPTVVAEQMALALFAARPEFVRDATGRWSLAPAPLAPTAVPTPTTQPVPEIGEPLSALSYVVVDVETTGSRPWGGDRVTEVAAIVVRDGAVAEQFETLVNPERSIPPMITALTQISWAMVKDAPTFRQISDDLLRVLEGHVFVAHNAEFDWRFLCAEFGRATGQRLHSRRLCTVRLARRLLPQLSSRRLDAVAHHYGVEITARHRAGGDAIATAHILLRLLRDARDRDCQHWGDLQQLLGARARGARRRRPPAMPQPVARDTTA